MDSKLKQLIEFIHEQHKLASEQHDSHKEKKNSAPAFFYSGKQSQCMDILLKAEQLISSDNNGE